jgi:RTX calcium-binding nonapeptide repeat (4 copies)
MDKQMRRLTLLIATMAIALVLSAGAAVALTLDCTAGRGCVGTDEPDTLNGSIGNDDMDGRQATDQLFGNDGEDWMQGDAYAPTDTSTDGDERLFGGAGFDGMIGYGGDDLLSGGTRGDFIDAKENSENPGEDTVRGGRGRDYIDAIDMTKDTINCGNGTKDEVFYDENLDSVENCEIASTEYPEEFIGAASAEETNTLSAR